jgi:hypothetical protein
VDLHGLIICHSPIWDNISIPFILVGRLTDIALERGAIGARSIGKKKITAKRDERHDNST